MEASCTASTPDRRIRQLVASGVIGEPKIVRATFDFLLSRSNDMR